MVLQMLLPSFPELQPDPPSLAANSDMYIHYMVSSATNTIGIPSRHHLNTVASHKSRKDIFYFGALLTNT